MCPELHFEIHDLLPPEVRGVLLGRNNGLKPEERALIASQLKGKWHLVKVTKELRNAWADEDLRAYDGKVAQNTATPERRGFHRARAHYQEADVFDDHGTKEYLHSLEEALAAAHEELEALDAWGPDESAHGLHDQWGNYYGDSSEH